MTHVTDPPEETPADPPKTPDAPPPVRSAKPSPPGPSGAGWIRWVIVASIILLVGGAFARMALAPGDALEQARALLAERAETEMAAEKDKPAATRARGEYQRCGRVCVLEVWAPLERCMDAAREDSPDLTASRKTCWAQHEKTFEPCLAACGEASKSYAGVGLDPMVAEMLRAISREDARRLATVPERIASTAPPKSAEIGGVKVTRGEAEMGPPTSLESLLPYLTEGSLFLLVGFGLGALTRMLIKGVLIVLVLFAGGLMFLETKEFVTVDWGPMLDWVRTSVLNLSQNESIAGFLTTKLPTMGTLGVGYLIGLKRR